MSTPRLYGNPPKCSAHSNSGSGCARYHVDGCVVCGELRTKGVVKPNAPAALKQRQKGTLLGHKFVDWNKAAEHQKAERLNRLGPDVRGRG